MTVRGILHRRHGVRWDRHDNCCRATVRNDSCTRSTTHLPGRATNCRDNEVANICWRDLVCQEGHLATCPRHSGDSGESAANEPQSPTDHRICFLVGIRSGTRTTVVPHGRQTQGQESGRFSRCRRSLTGTPFADIVHGGCDGIGDCPALRSK